MTDNFSQFREALAAWMATASLGESSDSHFNEFALRLFRLQYEAVLPFRRLCDARGITPQTLKHWTEIPAIPTTLFKELELTSIPPADRVAAFHSSGTTVGHSSKHYHSAESLRIYENSLLPWFTRHLVGDWDDLAAADVVGPLDKPGFIILTPPPEKSPNSSLLHMFETVRREVGSRDSFFGGSVNAEGAWELDIEKTLFGLRKSMCANRPVVLMGTAFSFVHLLDHFAANNIRYRLAKGSRVLETGGYKGRSRELPKSELHGLITRHLGIPDSHIICEYGMSELSSQAYDRAIAFEDPELPSKTPAARTFRFPPWARARIISPETGRDVAEGQTGLILVIDLANVHSVMAIQTEDLGIRRGTGFELIGRAAIAEPRGCSLMAV